MKIVGIIGKVNLNKENKKEIEILQNYNKALLHYSDVVTIGILPPKNIDYFKISHDDEFNVNNDELKRLDKVLDMCDGFIIIGGSEWLSHEEYIIKYAYDNDKPLLGVCSGMQALCSYFSSKSKDSILVKISETLDTGINHSNLDAYYAHSIVILKDSFLHRIINKDEIDVNSRHLYCVTDTGSLNVDAISSDGVIEAVSMPNKRFIVGLQWHPELLCSKDENQRKILDEFYKRM